MSKEQRKKWQVMTEKGEKRRKERKEWRAREIKE